MDALTLYGFDLKVSLDTTLTKGFVVSMRSMPGNSYDGHTLHQTIEHVALLTEHKPTTGAVNKGYRGAHVDGVYILGPGQRAASPRRSSSDQAPQCHQAGHRAHEGGQTPDQQPA